MLRYLTPLDLRVYKPGLFVVLADYKIEIEHAGGRYVIAVPRGLITDLASVPKVVQCMPDFDVNGGSRHAAVMHDWLYSQNGKITAIDCAESTHVWLTLTRDDCDQLLRQGLIMSGLPIEVANAFYAGVVIGGQSHWDGNNAAMDFVGADYWAVSA